jgi:hypothetical protein
MKKTKENVVSWCASLDGVLRPDYAISGEGRVCARNDLIDKLCYEGDLDGEVEGLRKLWEEAQEIGWDIEEVKILKLEG